MKVKKLSYSSFAAAAELMLLASTTVLLGVIKPERDSYFSKKLIRVILIVLLPMAVVIQIIAVLFLICQRLEEFRAI